MERNTPLTVSNPPSLRHKYTTLLESVNSFQQSFALNWNNIVEKLESFDNAIESRRAEIEKQESLIDLRLGEVEKQEAELSRLKVSLEAKLRDVERREEECEKVDDRLRRVDAERLNIERMKEDNERIEGMKRECERLKLKEIELENRLKEVELKEVHCMKKLEEVERLKESVNEESKLKEMEFLMMWEEFERSKLAASEALELKETKLEKEQKATVMEYKKKLDEIERSKQIEFETLKLREIEFAKQLKEVELKEMKFLKMWEEFERSKLTASEALKLKETELEKQRKEMELKEMKFLKMSEEFERSKLAALQALKLKEAELEMQQRGVVMDFKKKLDEIERSKQIASEVTKLMDAELKKQQKGLELKELELRNKFEEHERSKLIHAEELKRKEKELDKQQKGLELKELELKRMLDAVETSEEVASEALMGLEKQQKELGLKELEFRNKFEEHERSKLIDSRELNRKEIELMKREKVLELKELGLKNKSDEIERSKQIASEAMKLMETELEEEQELKWKEFKKKLVLEKKLNKVEKLKQIALEADDDGETDVIDYPDSEFYNFANDKLESSFAVNQIWALYDPMDSMPRSYAQIKKVLHRPVFRLQIVWLEPRSDDVNEQLWHDANLPVGCGKFKIGDVTTVDLSVISHHMLNAGRDTCQIYPKKGETWAIFKDWDMKWLSEPDKHHSQFQFEYVEIASDFDPRNGVVVSYLGKVKGFVSTFQAAVVQDGVIIFCIPPNELYRFSHRVPSHRLKGDERAGIPAGSFELDPAALPGNLFESFDSGDAKRKGHLDCKCQEISSSFIPRKRQKNEVAGDVLSPLRCPAIFLNQLIVGETRTVSTIAAEPYDFNSERSEDKFSAYQVWAMFSYKDGLPRIYGRIEKIIKSPDLKLHVRFLKPCSALKDVRQPPCWGTFIVEQRKTSVVPITMFSHRMRVKLVKDKYKIYPGQGEIWALRRNKTSETSSRDDAGEYDAVAVYGVDDSGASVVFMQRGHIAGRHFYRLPRSKPDVTKIALFEYTRFSHRCCASQQAVQEDDRLKGVWEIDPKSLPGL